MTRYASTRWLPAVPSLARLRFPQDWRRRRESSARFEAVGKSGRFEDRRPLRIAAAEASGKDDASKGNKPARRGAPAAPLVKKSYYVPTRGYRLEPQPDIPPYVRNLAKTYKEFEGIDWLNVGLDSRVRFEYRKDDYRPWTNTTTNPPTSQRKYFPNSLWLSRTRAYLGVQNILDPFRFVSRISGLARLQQHL